MISEIENKIHTYAHAKYITTQGFSKLTPDDFTARLNKVFVRQSSLLVKIGQP